MFRIFPSKRHFAVREYLSNIRTKTLKFFSPHIRQNNQMFQKQIRGHSRGCPQDIFPRPGRSIRNVKKTNEFFLRFDQSWNDACGVFPLRKHCRPELQRMDFEVFDSSWHSNSILHDYQCTLTVLPFFRPVAYEMSSLLPENVGHRTHFPVIARRLRNLPRRIGPCVRRYLRYHRMYAVSSETPAMNMPSVIHPSVEWNCVSVTSAR